MGDTRGVLGFGKREGHACFQSQYQTGAGTAAHFRAGGAPPTIPGYSGHVPGKYAGNVFGGTFDKTCAGSQAHLKTTDQTMRVGAKASLRNCGLLVFER